MTTIIDGCKDPADVIAKKTKFYALLKQNSISEDDYTQYYSEQNHKYNLEDKDFLFDKDDLQQPLKYLNFINIHRKGKNSNPFERIGYVLLSGTSNTLRLAWDKRINPNEDIPLATDLIFLTNKFWFKLNKGFGKSEHPKSFDIVTKAQILLSAQLNSTVSDKYEELQLQLTRGELSQEEAISTIASLRREAKKPEEINEYNIENILSSIEENSIEAHLKEQELLRQKAKEQEAENLKLKKTEAQLKEEIKKKEEENKQIENELSKYRGAERVKKLEDYQNDQWNNFINSKKEDSSYFKKIVFLALLPILVGIILRSVKPLNNWIESLGAYQWLIWGGLAIISLIEFFGPAYLFDKEKIKSGWLWLTTNKDEKQILKMQKFYEYKNKFDKTN